MRAKNSAAMATGLDQKIERLLKAMEGISSRLDKIDLKFDKLENRINYHEHKVEQRYEEIKQTTDNKIFGLTVRIKELENYKADTEKAALMQESYNKRLNILIHGIEEDEDSVWESHQKTLEKMRWKWTLMTLRQLTSTAFPKHHKAGKESGSIAQS